MEMRRFSLSPEQKQQVKAQIQHLLESREEVLFAYLHGSFLLDVPFEDIDIAVYLREDMVSNGEWLKTAFRLADTIEGRLGLPVDVQVLNTAPRGVQFTGSAGELLCSRDEEFRCRFVERLWLEIMDFDYHARQMLKEALQG
ncbi:MAG: nucleotidyltransferase domain-containing protein [Firmicutes bacterium]|nr:nucleotidyltransferase domain-containing protein [Bacillota bacterium]